MERPTCETCPYWEQGNHEHDQDFNGWCHRYPKRIVETVLRLSVDEEIRRDPSLVDDRTLDCLAYDLSSDNITSCFPTHDKYEWCGEHPQFPAYIESLKRPHGIGLTCKQVADKLREELSVRPRRFLQRLGDVPFSDLTIDGLAGIKGCGYLAIADICEALDKHNMLGDDMLGSLIDEYKEVLGVLTQRGVTLRGMRIEQE
jgi:hypothetical protein